MNTFGTTWLENSPLRSEKHRVASVLSAALQAVDPAAAVKRELHLKSDGLLVGDRKFPLGAGSRIVVVGAGKASARMAQAAAEILEPRLAGGVIVTRYGSAVPAGNIKIIEAGHPVPDEAGVEGARQIIELLQSSGEHDVVLCLISGGGSALLPLPAANLSLGDVQRTTNLLLRSGATIQQLNCVRKHLAALTGGQLVRHAAPAQVISLILSDVVGSPLHVIASGPTVPDPTTFRQAWDILERFQLPAQVPGQVRDRLQMGKAGKLPETPKPGDALFDQVYNMVIGSNIVAATAALEAAREQGFNTLFLTSYLEGEAREVAHAIAAVAKEIAASSHPCQVPACVVAGGETTVTVRGTGKGGRNQEIAVAGSLALDGWSKILMVALATDGSDGPTEAAGGVCDGNSVSRARELHLNPIQALSENNTFPYLESLGDLLVTGPTYTNVNDLLFLFVFSGASPPGAELE
ncbi:MAG: glycerate kinase [Chloroflexi bacterium]|nr:glycerate kinase [Chloroflexota bacterium]